MQGPRAVLSDRTKTGEMGSEMRQIGKGTHTTTNKIWQNLNISLGKSGMLLHSFCRMVQVKSIYVNVT